MNAIQANLPALQVVLPLLAAPLCVVLWRGGPAWLLATVAAWLSFLVSIALLWRVGEVGTISYELGSWAPPWGIEYRVDYLNAFVMLLISGTASCARRNIHCSSSA